MWNLQIYNIYVYYAGCLKFINKYHKKKIYWNTLCTCSPILFLSLVASLAAANPSAPEEHLPRQTKISSPESRTKVSPWFILLQDIGTSLSIGIFPPAT